MKTYRKLHRWHRRLGVIASLFLILLAITGILLNHTDQFKLDHKYVSSAAMLDWYNIAPPSAPVSFATEKYRLSQLGSHLYFAEEEVADHTEILLGAVEIGDEVIVALRGELLIFDGHGNLLEKLGGAEGVPTGMKRIGLVMPATPKVQLIVEGSHGNYLADLEALQWEEEFPDDLMKGVYWSKASGLSGEMQEEIYQAYRGKGLTLERVLLDLHSGRIVGGVGVFLVDIAAILFLFLAITGVWMWSRNR